ncbi:PaaI family thioesterase [Cryptosporangium minutisporangium]|uniref:Thioesterase domain-containing protein n=1 Tax=Cryptosporangium minutisporangium TaxID=113569 RepID=A0ABP6TCC4_9ACTN
MTDEQLVSERGIPAGERYADGDEWENRGSAGPHLWRTLGYRRVGWSPGRSVVEWDATVDYCFPSAGGPIVQGGLVTALLDAAMGGACWTVLDRDQAFLTADLRVEFLRSSRPGLLRGTGEVIRRTRRVVFCAAELHDADGVLLATSRCTQVLLPADGRAGRYGPPEADGGPPRDARG